MTNPIRVAVIGVGNCFSSLIQGISYYQQTKEDVVGIGFPDIGGYKPTDIEFVLAFDVDNRKVGKTLKEAVFAPPNCARVFHTDLINSDLIVTAGYVMDGVAQHMRDMPPKYGFQVTDDPVDITDNMIIDYLTNKIMQAAPDVIVNYLPVGSNHATEVYAKAAINAGVPFVNCIPVLSLNSPEWEQKFVDARLPYIGSDMKSQFGASILSQMLQELAFKRGMHVQFHQQLNIGGNTDFGNMLDSSRLKHKKVSKENVIKSQNEIHNVPVDDEAIFAGPSTWIPYLKDNKVAYFNMRMLGFGGAQVDLDIKLSVQDSENSAGVVIDAVRFLKVAHELGVMGCVRGPSAWTQKSPPKQLSSENAWYECSMLAERQLTVNLERQLDPDTAMEFAWEEFNTGGMEYLKRV